MSLIRLRHSLVGRLTMHVKANIKIASRYLLPLELYMAMTMISWGISGGIAEGGKLYQALNAADSADTILDSNVWWAIGLCSVGAFQALVSSLELFTGRRWVPKLIFLSVSMRCVAAFASSVLWVVILYIQITTPSMHAIVSMWMQTPLSIIFNAVAYGGNLKVRSVLDSKIPTGDLEERILHKRRNLIPQARRGL